MDKPMSVYLLACFWDKFSLFLLNVSGFLVVKGWGVGL